MTYRNILFFILLITGVLSCEKEAPEVITYSPEFGPAETLITVEGMHFDDIKAINFNEGVPADFNLSYATDKALLFRVPERAPLGDNMITIETSDGVTKFPFRVTLKPPLVKNFYPESANTGSYVTIIGENFFEPLEVLFVDSVSAKIIYSQEDSLVVEVPPGIEKGKIKVKANGGPAETATIFFSTTEILINDFDGNGLRSETDKWLFYGAIDQRNQSPIHNSNPEATEGNFLKLSGSGSPNAWIGGTEHHSNDLATFDTYPIVSDINNTFLEFDVNNNGKKSTHLIVVMAERNGSFKDFSEQIPIDWEGWRTVRISLNRMTDLDGFTVDPAKIRTVKFHLINANDASKNLEVNLDNIKFVQIN